MKRWKTQKYRENGCNITVYQRRIDQMQNAGCGHSRLNKIESTDKNNFYSESFQCDDCKTIFLPTSEHKKWLCLKVIKFLREEACRDVPDDMPQKITQMMRYVADYLEATS